MKQKSKITIIQTADIHAYLNPHTELFVENDNIVFRSAGGLAHIKTLTDKIRSENPEGTIFVDGGDFFQGSGESVLSKGKIFPPLVCAMNYDLLIPGNWEVVYGKQVMLDLMNSYSTNVIVANMFHEDTNEPIYPPYWMTEKAGVKLGFIAYNDPEIPERQNPAYSKGLKFTKVEDNLKQLVQKLKVEHQVDILFLITHIGISKQLLLADNPATEGVDFILGNDTHERIRKPIVGKYAQVVEPGAFGSFIGRLDIEWVNNKIEKYTYELTEVNPTKYKADETIQKLVDDAQEQYKEKMQRVLGYTTTPLYRYLVVENPMDNMITDALLWKTGADFAASNGFRFGVPIVPDATGRQAITIADLWRMLPTDEYMKIGEVTGQQIKDWLEKEINNVFAANPTERFGGWLVRFSGLTLKFDSSKTMGNRIVELKIQGTDLDISKNYRMAACNRTGEPEHILCRLRNAKNVKIKDYTLHEAISAYLQEKETVSPHIDGRAIAIDLGVNSFSKIPEKDYFFR
ncbi:bifunctional metallophosphatase/5'-nucleotidase [Sphingobacterium sp. UT-1RO-CII-1]|uniref:bifunctional metallophosphatase/5'-nucleotidase n=1 Tax=Sphingobacterium sp. UT-1RO-CII-1 TaxID=2995225 RepID=UPI00227B4226|nr:bifunctional metallophosphatase/5'-nucleotidase [Sphingobacterium sp. UT-1RO-CII-1]MCY4780006.1 bifunctional metallophosphatase/5'-nucleotidase [Sphingobacterium sp. UT-1RO-CII-1]